MKYLDLTLPTPAANLACDEALLDGCEEQGSEVVRFWEPQEYFVVLGFSNQVAREVDVAACQREKVGVYRRCSGGGTVLQGPGCLNYSLILNIDGDVGLETITSANCHIMSKHKAALESLLRQPVHVRGHTDLAFNELKFSGNAQRRKRRALIFHGTFLLRFDLAMIDKFLPMPSRQPDYRQNRPHKQFLTNLPLDADALKQALREAWNAREPLEVVPDCKRLVAEKYSTDSWNLKF
jgi:lipoate---protein ligase